MATIVSLPKAPASDGSVWIAGANEYGGVVTTPDALTTPSGYIGEASYLKHFSPDGTEQLYGTYLVYPGTPDLLFALGAAGIVLAPSSTAFFITQNFNTARHHCRGPRSRG